MWKDRSKVLFLTCAVISGSILFQMATYLLHVLLHWEMKFNLIQICHNLMLAIGLSSVGYILDVLALSTLILAVWHLLRQTYLTRRMLHRFQRMRDDRMTEEVNEARQIARHPIIVISHCAPIAVTMGFFKPRIIISTGLIDLLKPNELHAVIHHESYHQKHLDPLKTYLLSLFSSVLWYMPILKWLQKEYKITRELLADDYAISRLGTPVELGSALLKLVKNGRQPRMPFSYVSFADTTINYRIKQIIEPGSLLPLQPPWKQTIISLQMFALLCTMFFLTLL